MNDFLSGGIMVASFVVGLFFLRFWRRSRDRLFLMFAIAFWVMGANRIPLRFVTADDEFHLSLYIVRLLAFMLILAAIIDKNQRKSDS